MKCEADYCIYNRKWECLLDHVALNSLTMCEECMMVSIPSDILDKLKEEQLRFFLMK